MGGLLNVVQGVVDIQSSVETKVYFTEGVYSFYDNYSLSGFILSIAPGGYSGRSGIIAGSKSESLNIEYKSDGVYFYTTTARTISYRKLCN